jgi:hypothetical protein
MADHWISFRVKKDTSYDARYRALVKAIEEIATGGQWSADTSFVCVRSKYSLKTCGEHLKKALNGTTDHLVIRQIGYRETYYINEPGEDFEAFFPDAKKL